MKNFLVVLMALGIQGTVAHRAAAQVERPPLRRDREALQQRFQERFARAVRDGVGLSDEQMPKLLELNRRFEGRRRELLLHERNVRIGLRDELAPGTTPNEDEVRKLLDEQMRVQRDRLQLMEEEQQELATFMTPSQRARYFGMQEQMRRKVEQLRSGSPGGPDGEPPPVERRRLRRQPPDTAMR